MKDKRHPDARKWGVDRHEVFGGRSYPIEYSSCQATATGAPPTKILPKITPGA